MAWLGDFILPIEIEEWRNGWSGSNKIIIKMR